VGLFVLLALTSVLALAACGSDGETTASGTATAADSGGETGDTVKVAFLDAAQANTYLEATYNAMQEVADAENAEITVFDAQLDPSKQQSQLQNVLTTGDYDGIVIAPLNGPAVKPLIEKAIADGIAVGSTNLPIGDDFSTTKPEVKDLSVAALRPGLESGQTMGELTVEACKGTSPCEIAYIYGLKSLGYDLAIREGFDQTIASDSAAEVVAEAEGEFSASASLEAAQNIIQAHPDLDVLAVAGDQMALGAQKAIEDGDVKIIGLGGSIPAQEAIEAGRWFGTAALLPADEGKIAMEGVIKDVQEGVKTGGVDPVIDLPNRGKVTSDTAAEFTPQWKG
jgi:ribose transport system substrate-binding protein